MKRPAITVEPAGTAKVSPEVGSRARPQRGPETRALSSPPRVGASELEFAFPLCWCGGKGPKDAWRSGGRRHAKEHLLCSGAPEAGLELLSLTSKLPFSQVWTAPLVWGTQAPQKMRALLWQLAETLRISRPRSLWIPGRGSWARCPVHFCSTRKSVWQMDYSAVRICLLLPPS